MASETDLTRRTIVVFNPKSGSGLNSPEYLNLLFDRYWPAAVSFLAINRVNDNPSVLSGANVVSWGGDGTNCKVAGYSRESDDPGWSLLLDAGTIGDTPKDSGLGKKPSEPVGAYIDRVATMLATEKLEVREYVPGKIINGGTDYFLWTAGTGIAERVLSRIEEARSRKLVKFVRLVHGLTGVINDLKEENNLEVLLPGRQDPIKAVDVNFVHNFNRFGSMTLPFAGDNQLWIIPKPAKKRDAFRTAVRLAWDAFRMKMKLNPTTGAVEISTLEEGQEIRIQGEINNMQVDSEIHRVRASDVRILTSPEENTRKYRLLVEKT